MPDQKPTTKQQELKNTLRDLANFIIDYIKPFNNPYHFIATTLKLESSKNWIIKKKDGTEIEMPLRGGFEMQPGDKLQREIVDVKDEDRVREWLAKEHNKSRFGDVVERDGNKVSTYWGEKYKEVKPDEIPQKEVKETLKKIMGHSNHLFKLQKSLEEIRQRFEEITQRRFREPFSPTGDIRDVRTLTNIIQVEMFLFECGYKKEEPPSYYSSFKSSLAELLRKQREEYLQDWSKEIEELSPAGARKGEGFPKDVQPEDKNPVKVIADISTGQMWLGKEKRDLESLDIKLLKKLNEVYKATPGKVALKDDLIKDVWMDEDDPDSQPYDDQLYIRIGNLREAFKGLKIPCKIKTYHGRGYAIVSKKNIIFEIK